MKTNRKQFLVQSDYFEALHWGRKWYEMKKDNLEAETAWAMYKHHTRNIDIEAKLRLLNTIFK